MGNRHVVHSGPLPAELGGGTAAAGGGMRPLADRPPVWTTTSVGATVSEAIANLHRDSPRIPFLPHLKVILFGEDLARGGILPALDALDRERERRRPLPVTSARPSTGPRRN